MTVNINNALPIGHGFIRDGTIDASRFMLVNADGSINVNAAVSITPTPIEQIIAGIAVPVGDGTGGSSPLQISGSISAATSAYATTAAPSYTNNTAQNLSQNLTGDLRTITKQNGSWIVGVDQTSPGLTNAVDVTNFPVAVDTNSGNVSASTIRLVIANDQPQLNNALKSQLTPAASGGLTSFSDSIDATTNATLVKNSPGQIYGIEIFNNAANIGYLKFYDSASLPTPGAGTPAVRMMVPGNATGAGVVRSYENGMNFVNGIAYTFVAGIDDSDATPVSAAEFLVNIYYK